MKLASPVIAASDLIPHPEYANHFTVKSYAQPNARLSIQPDGTITARPNDTEIGPWELCQVSGAKVVWHSDAYPTGSYALPLADGI